MIEHATPNVTCPNCNYEMTSSSCLSSDDALPAPGDYTLCIKCGEIMTYTKGLFTRSLTQLEFQQLDDEMKHKLLWTQKKIKELNHGKN